MNSQSCQELSTEEIPNFVRNLTIKKLIPVTIGLVGELGAGKTTLVKCIVESLGGDTESVCSPSYNLMNEYQSSQYLIEHWDLYRLKNLPEELNYAPEGDLLRLVEWSNLIEKPKGIIDYQIYIEVTSEDLRRYSFTKLDTLPDL